MTLPIFISTCSFSPLSFFPLSLLHFLALSKNSLPKKDETTHNLNLFNPSHSHTLHTRRSRPIFRSLFTVLRPHPFQRRRPAAGGDPKKQDSPPCFATADPESLRLHGVDGGLLRRGAPAGKVAGKCRLAEVGEEENPREPGIGFRGIRDE